VSQWPRNSGLKLVSAVPSNQADNSNLPAYRPYTRALLQRYFRMAVDIGRLPSILGGLCFRARVSSYKLNTFEDAVIFVHDIERVFDRMDRHFLEIIAGVVLLDYSIPEAALRLGITVQRAERRFAAALDSLALILLEVGLLRSLFKESEEDGGQVFTSASENSLPPKKPPVTARIEAQAPVHRRASNNVQ